MTFRRWDVISVPFPFVEIHGTKRRPALVVSTDSLHRAHGVCFAAMITTARNLGDLRADDIEIGDLGKAQAPATVRDPPRAARDLRVERPDPDDWRPRDQPTPSGGGLLRCWFAI